MHIDVFEGVLKLLKGKVWTLTHTVGPRRSSESPVNLTCMFLLCVLGKAVRRKSCSGYCSVPHTELCPLHLTPSGGGSWAVGCAASWLQSGLTGLSEGPNIASLGLGFSLLNLPSVGGVVPQSSCSVSLKLRLTFRC